jgi:hypothetical protein
MKFIIPTMLLVAAALTGCAHGVMRGSVAMKAANNEAHVCLGDGEVKVGDRVKFFKSECNAEGGLAGFSCKKIERGGGTVLQTLNEHYSIVKVDEGVAFEEGTIVEKQ